MNPNRDTEAAKKIEREAAWRVELITGRRVALMPDKYSPFDWTISKVDPDGVAMLEYLAEFRNRPDITINTYPTIVIDVDKVVKVVRQSELMVLSAPLFVLQVQDGSLWRAPLSTEYKIWKNYQRNQEDLPSDGPKDVYLVPRGKFRPFR